MSSFNIKLISGTNLILVQSSGYRSEIFQPVIIDGVIHLNNVIKPEKKSSTALRNSTNKIKVLSVQISKNAEFMSDIGTFNLTTKDTSKRTTSSAGNSLASSGYFSTNSVDTPPAMRACSKAPVKHSTPVLFPDIVSERNITAPYTNFLSSHGKQQEVLARSSSSFATPSPILSHSLKNPKPKKPLFSFRPSQKIVKLYRKSTESYPQNIAKTVDISNVVKKNNTASVTPAKSLRKSRGPQTPATVTKWRKCITPAKTYSKRGNIQRKQQILRSVKKTGFNIPYQTVGIEGSAELTVKTIRATIDQRTTIGPKEFKQQMKFSDDLKNSYSLDVKTKEEFYHARYSAFDLLVNPVRKKSFSQELRRMFRTRCTRKSAPVEAKFKLILDDIPSLECIPSARKRVNF